VWPEKSILLLPHVDPRVSISISNLSSSLLRVCYRTRPGSSARCPTTPHHPTTTPPYLIARPSGPIFPSSSHHRPVPTRASVARWMLGKYPSEHSLERRGTLRNTFFSMASLTSFEGIDPFDLTSASYGVFGCMKKWGSCDL
jgi:hypothetical protein